MAGLADTGCPSAILGEAAGVKQGWSQPGCTNIGGSTPCMTPCVCACKRRISHAAELDLCHVTAVSQPLSCPPTEASRSAGGVTRKW